MTVSQSPLSQATDDRLSQMLFQGEEVKEEFTLEGARVAVTTHRVLVFTPDREGRRFDHADRPNVIDASVETTGADSYVGWSVRAAIYGAVLFGGGVLLETSGILDGLGGTQPPQDAPGADIAQLVSLLPKAFDALTAALLVGGGLLVVVALALAGLYFSSRERELVIERAGQDPMRVPVRDDDAKEVARRLRTAVGTGSKPRSD